MFLTNSFHFYIYAYSIYLLYLVVLLEGLSPPRARKESAPPLFLISSTSSNELFITTTRYSIFYHYSLNIFFVILHVLLCILFKALWAISIFSFYLQLYVFLMWLLRQTRDKRILFCDVTLILFYSLEPGYSQL